MIVMVLKFLLDIEMLDEVILMVEGYIVQLI